MARSTAKHVTVALAGGDASARWHCYEEWDDELGDFVEICIWIPDPSPTATKTPTKPPTATYTPRPTNTPYPVATPSPRGSLRADDSSIYVGETTRVEAYNIQPSNLGTSFYISGAIARSGRCSSTSADGVDVVRISGVVDSVRVEGCTAGTGIVRLVSDGNDELDWLSIKVKSKSPEPPTPSPVPTPTRRGSVGVDSVNFHVGETVKVYAYGVEPSDLAVKFRISGPIDVKGHCSSTDKASDRQIVHTSFTLEGCGVGTGTVRLLASSDNHELDRTNVHVAKRPATPAPPPSPAPGAPTGVRVVPYGSTSVSVSWNAVSGASRYELQQRIGTSGSWTTVSDAITSLSRTVSGLTCGNNYYFKVRARGDKWGPYSGSVLGTPLCPPPAPSGVTANSSGAGVVVSWNVVDGASKYQLQFKDEHSENWKTYDADIVDVSRKVTGLICGTTYNFRVRARGDGEKHADDWGPYSQQATGTASCLPGSFPDFGTATIPALTYQVGHSVLLRLPPATGGDGALTYSISPTMWNGLTFDAQSRTIKGTPNVAVGTAIYTYTATDVDGDTADLSLSVTVFDVSVMVGNSRFEDLEWSVLGYEAASFRDPVPRSITYQFRLQIPASTGFEMNGSKSCKWDTTSIVRTEWISYGDKFHLIRCGIGSGATVRVDAWIRKGENGTASRLYTEDLSIPQSWHRDDHRADYYVVGTDGTKIIGIWDGTTEGLFPSLKPSGIDPDYEPNPALLKLVNYSNAADAWNAVQDGGVTVEQAIVRDGADVVIRGYWDPHPKTDKCGKSIACTYGAGTYPHLGDQQPFWIEDPPRWSDEDAKMWTTIFKDADDLPDKYQYLPVVLMHEFGHTIGLGHSAGSDVMASALLETLSDYDADGLENTYKDHTPH